MPRRILLAITLLCSSLPALAAARETLELRHERLRLPGAPSLLLPVDLDGDGRRDLVVVLAYTEIESIGLDRFENMMQVSTVIPALFDRREVRAYLGAEDGSFLLAGAPLRLERSVLALAAGPSAAPVVALPDEGI